MLSIFAIREGYEPAEQDGSSQLFALLLDGEGKSVS